VGAERFHARTKRIESGCVLWLGATSAGTGYGKVRLSNPRRLVGAHRLAWELAHCPIPDGLCVLHRCDVRTCVNPDHLYLGTKRDNARDMVSRGRWSNGRQHGPNAPAPITAITKPAPYTLQRFERKIPILTTMVIPTTTFTSPSRVIPRNTCKKKGVRSVARVASNHTSLVTIRFWGDSTSRARKRKARSERLMPTPYQKLLLLLIYYTGLFLELGCLFAILCLHKFSHFLCRFHCLKVALYG
jgi:hypothetical protein